MLTGVARAFSDDIAVDLGTANTIVYVAGRGVIIDEPSVVAVQTVDGSRAILAVGMQAKALLGRTPEPIELVRPLRDGVIADFLAVEEMLRQFLLGAKRAFGFLRPRILVCVPSGATPLERKAVRDATLQMRASQVLMVEEPVAAALGAGLPIERAHAFMVVDIGGGTTDIAVMREGRIVATRSIRIAGNAMDEAIMRHVRARHRLVIGERNAEYIKMEAGRAGPGIETGEEVDVLIKGREIGSGRLKSVTLGAQDVAEALADPVARLGDFVERALEDLPRRIVLEVANVGIVLTGGGALLAGLDAVLSERLGMRVAVAADPLHCVIRGTAILLDGLDRHRDLLLKT
ncbi:MAG: rod shape-determining protein [Hyphomicrobiaceae bacterium]|nr:rod shape-determining protein [Hyphomicrobiaceae bacterium]